MNTPIKHSIVIYRFSGRQGFFYIPKSWCKECDLLINLVQNIIEREGLKEKVELSIRPWWLWWFIPLFKYGSFRAPQLIIDGQLISAGLVPKESDIINIFSKAQ